MIAHTPRAGARVDVHGCAIDSDFDGVPDGIDQCPSTPYGEGVDARGMRASRNARAARRQSSRCGRSVIATAIGGATATSCKRLRADCLVQYSATGACARVADDPSTSAGAFRINPAGGYSSGLDRSGAVSNEAHRAGIRFTAFDSRADRHRSVPGATPLISNSAPTVVVPLPLNQNAH